MKSTKIINKTNGYLIDLRPVYTTSFRGKAFQILKSAPEFSAINFYVYMINFGHAKFMQLVPLVDVQWYYPLTFFIQNKRNY